MERLSALDAEFLNMEDDTCPMHIAGVCVFDDPAPSLEELRELVGSKLHLIPRYRQRVRSVPLELGRPVWVDDEDFDLSFHVGATRLAEPTDAALVELMGDRMSVMLDRDRPLWEMTLVEGLEADRWALLCKVHHCMVDGIAGVQLLTVMLDLEPELRPHRPLDWEPAPTPSSASLVVDAWAGLAGDVLGWARRLPDAVVHPRTAVRVAGQTAGGLLQFARNLWVTPPSSFEGRIGRERSWAHGSAPLGDVKTIRASFGGTVNDVVLAAVAGGCRSLLEARDEDPAAAVVRTMIPVSVRRPEAGGVPDNRVSTLLYELPVGIADPVERLESVIGHMTELKGSHMAEAGELVTEVGNLAPPMLVGTATRLAIRTERLVPQRVINTVTTNVPGPQFPLYCLGREMLAYLPYVPLSHGVRVATAILSYNGRLSFGVTGDAATVPEVDVVARGAVEEIHRLRDRALAPRSGRRRRPARRSS